jgi:hypothetical protein
MPITGLCIPNIENMSIFCFLALCGLKMVYTLYKASEGFVSKLFRIFPLLLSTFYAQMAVKKAFYFVLSQVLRTFSEEKQL